MKIEDEGMDRVSSLLCGAMHLAGEMINVPPDTNRAEHFEWTKSLVCDRYCIGDERDKGRLEDLYSRLMVFAKRIAEAKHG